MEFEKAWRIRQDPEIKTGIVKCRDVILNTVGVGALSYDNKVFEKVINEIRKKEEQRKREQAKKKKKKKKTSSQMILGKMQEDVEFLEDFIKFQNKQSIGQKGLKMTAVSALDYLEKRKTSHKSFN